MSEVNFWKLKPTELFAETERAAQGAYPAATDSDKAEAARLANEWRDALAMSHQSFEDEERRESTLDSLTHRTISVLVKLSGEG